MSKVHVLNVVVGPNVGNPAPFLSKIEFEITFECMESLPEDLVWKIIYVGSAESEEYDQILDTVYVGPIPEGRHKFVFEADPPDARKIPVSDIVDVTVVLLTCGYREQEFIRIGYYVNNGYTDPELLETPPENPQFDKLQRNILASNPRINKVKINWERTGTSSLKEQLASSNSTNNEISNENPITAQDIANTDMDVSTPTDDNTTENNSASTGSMPRFPPLHYDADDSMSSNSASSSETPLKETGIKGSNELENISRTYNSSNDNKERNMSSIDKALSESVKAFNTDNNTENLPTEGFMEMRES